MIKNQLICGTFQSKYKKHMQLFISKADPV